MSFPHLDPWNKITPALGTRPLPYFILGTRLFLGANPPRHQAAQPARLGVADEVLEVIATPGFDYLRRVSLC